MMINAQNIDSVKVGSTVKFELLHGGDTEPRQVTVTVTEIGDPDLSFAWLYGVTDAGVRYGLPVGFEGVESV